jgi:hypothetical protein
MVVKVVQLMVVDRSGRMVLVPELGLVVGHEKVDHRTLGQAVDVLVMWKVLEEADLGGVVYRRNRPTPHRFLLEVDLRA